MHDEVGFLMHDEVGFLLLVWNESRGIADFVSCSNPIIVSLLYPSGRI